MKWLCYVIVLMTWTLLLVNHGKGQMEKDDAEMKMILEKKLEDLKKTYEKLKNLVVHVEPAGNCDELYEQGMRNDGKFYIYFKDRFIRVYCQFAKKANDPNWMVIVRRENGIENFDRNWKNYTTGFGDLERDFWFGLDYLHLLTTDRCIVRVEMEDFEGSSAYAEYSSFRVAPANESYKLAVEGYSGDAGDSLSYHNEQAFSTYDVDNDNWSGNCAVERHGGWWYNSCSFVNLNGLYLDGGVLDPRGIHWFKWKDGYHSLKKVVMKIRPG